jgi:hypothetical protein
MKNTHTHASVRQPSAAQRHDQTPARQHALAWALALLVAATGLTFSSLAHAHKRGSGVSVAASAPKTLKAGETGTLSLKLGQVTAAEGASVEVRNPATGQVLYSSRLNRGESRTVNVDIVGASPGMQYLDIVTRQGADASVQTVAVSVGGARPALKREGQLKVTPGGEAVVSLPAKP